MSWPKRRAALFCVFAIPILFMKCSYHDTEEEHVTTERATKERSYSREDLIGTLSNFTADSNVPYKFLFDAERLINKTKKTSKDCDPHPPSPFDLKINNDIWQVAELGSVRFYALSAFYDDRPLALMAGRPVLRILGMFDAADLQKESKVSCLIWWPPSTSSELTYSTSPVGGYLRLFPKSWLKSEEKSLEPYLLSCPIDATKKNHGVPVAVSIIGNGSCEKTFNALKVLNERPDNDRKGRLAVCIKDINYPFQDLSIKLAEWAELNYAIGTEKIYLYDLQMHPKMYKVLGHYEHKGLVHVYPYKLPEFQPNNPRELVFMHKYMSKKYSYRSKQQVVVHTDCVLRNMHKYKYLAVTDIDEVIMPRIHNNYTDLIESLKNTSKLGNKMSASNFIFKNVYFLSKFSDPTDSSYIPPPNGTSTFPSYLHMMRSVIRSSEAVKPPKLVKSIVDTDRVLGMYQHFPLHCLGGPCKGFEVDEKVAFLAHYRQSCSKAIGKLCRRLQSGREVDTRVWHFKKAVEEGVAKILKELNLLP